MIFNVFCAKLGQNITIVKANLVPNWPKLDQVGINRLQVRPSSSKVGSSCEQVSSEWGSSAILGVQNRPWDQVKGCKDAPGIYRDALGMHQGCVK